MAMAAFGIPIGFRFLPTDEELVGYFLFKKLTGNLSPRDAMLVPEFDLYGKEEPWHLFQKNCIPHCTDDHYFFTKLKKKSKGSRIQRTVGVDGGCWHGEDSGKTIVAEVQINNQMVHIKALKKRFNYKNKKSYQHCRWIVHEFSLPEFINGDTVLCRLRKNDSTAKDHTPQAQGNLEFNNHVELNNTGYEFKSAQCSINKRKFQCNSHVELELNNSNGSELSCGDGSIKKRKLELNNTESNNGLEVDFEAWINSILLV